jgi:hypothetical protein
MVGRFHGVRGGGAEQSLREMGVSAPAPSRALVFATPPTNPLHLVGDVVDDAENRVDKELRAGGGVEWGLGAGEWGVRAYGKGGQDRMQGGSAVQVGEDFMPTQAHASPSPTKVCSSSFEPLRRSHIESLWRVRIESLYTERRILQRSVVVCRPFFRIGTWALQQEGARRKSGAEHGADPIHDREGGQGALSESTLFARSSPHK